MKPQNLNCPSVRAALCLGLSLTALLGVAIAALQGGAASGWLGGIALLLCLLTAAADLFWLVLPYLRMKKQLRHIIDSDRPEAMLCAPLGFSPVQRELFARLEKAFDHREILKLEIRESEILALQNQINPHFLYNTLEAIRSDALVYGAEDIATITESLATFFRYTISSLDCLVSLADEIHNVQDYFSIQQYRFGEGLEIEIAFSRHQQEMEQLFIPKMTLQPIIENAIFHGLEARESLGRIRIHIDRTPTVLLVCIEDNGVGMSDAQIDALNAALNAAPDTRKGEKPRRGGIALQNIHHRIQLLFGKEYGLHLLSAAGVGTETWLTLPIRTEAHYDF